MRDNLFDLEQEITQIKQASQQGFSETKEEYAILAKNRLLALEHQHLQLKQTKTAMSYANQLSAYPELAVQFEYQPNPLLYTVAHLWKIRSKWEREAMQLTDDLSQGKEVELQNNKLQLLTSNLQANAKKRSHDYKIKLETSIRTTNINNFKSIIAKNKLDWEQIDFVIKTTYPTELAEAISKETTLEQPKIREALKNYYIRDLNDNEEWVTISKDLDFGNNRKYQSIITPINELFDKTFDSYKKTGISSMSDRLTDDANKKFADRPTNFWHTQYKIAQGADQGKVIFEAFRSGTLAYTHGDVDDKRRKEISLNKTDQVLQAMLVHYLKNLAIKDPTKQQKILSGSDFDIAEFTVVSINLQTGTDIGVIGAEYQQIQDQREALELRNQKKIKLDVYDSVKTTKVSVNAKITVIPLNFGVNAASTISRQAYELQQEINKENWQMLVEVYNLYIKNNPFDKVAPKLWESINKKRNEGTAYELPSRLAYLAFRIGAIVHFNCKSGKDRTGIQDVETKFLAQQIYENKNVEPYVNKYKSGSTERDTYRKLLFESGNLEVQEKNTGAPGYKVAKNLPGGVPNVLEQKLKDRIGKVLVLVQGLEAFTDVKQTY